MSTLPCRTRDPDWWFPVSDIETSSSLQAQRLCGVCPIQAECLEDALERGTEHGIWGGKSALERRVLMAERTKRSKDGDHRNRTDLVRQLASPV